MLTRLNLKLDRVTKDVSLAAVEIHYLRCERARARLTEPKTPFPNPAKS
jgi:hypothetical protein